MGTSGPSLPLRLLPTASAGVVPLSVLLTGLLVAHASYAAFSGTTTNPTNSWSTGHLVLSDDDGGTDPSTGTAMFSATDIVPGDTGERCIAVTARTSADATLRLYVDAVTSSNAVSDYLHLTVQRGTGGSFAGGCTGFARSSSDFDGTLSQLAAAADFASGVGAQALPAHGSTTVSYRIAYTLDAAAPSSTQDGSATATFVWEARS